MIVLDTSVLSMALRRKKPRQPDETMIVEQLADVLRGNIPVAIPGIVIQELLSGVRSEPHFSALQKRLEPFPIVLATTPDHLRAARIVKQCRAKGLIVSSIDALIAAITLSTDAVLFTLDLDFSRLAQVVPLKLFAARAVIP